MDHFSLVPNGMDIYTIIFFGYKEWISDIWNFSRLLRPELKPKRV